jgi:3-hydroxy-9,10-secoandrosta-1,3,5(10)-triene-9,17-dione monooxygenase reductase component
MVITTLDADGTPQGLTATAFSSVCAEPPTCLICVSRAGRACRSIEQSGMFAINMLGAGGQSLSSRFATPATDKFRGVDWRPGAVLGCPILEQGIGAVECAVSVRHGAGDHDVFFGSIRSVTVRTGRPLLYFRGRYARLVDVEPSPLAASSEEAFFY